MGTQIVPVLDSGSSGATPSTLLVLEVEIFNFILNRKLDLGGVS